MIDLAQPYSAPVTHHRSHRPEGSDLGKALAETASRAGSAAVESNALDGNVAIHMDASDHFARHGKLYDGIDGVGYQPHPAAIESHPADTSEPILRRGIPLDAGGNEAIAFEVLLAWSRPLHTHLRVKGGIHNPQDLNPEIPPPQLVYELVVVVSFVRIRGATNSAIGLFALNLDSIPTFGHPDQCPAPCPHHSAMYYKSIGYERSPTHGRKSLQKFGNLLARDYEIR